jgi:hypothetical protein
MDAKSKQNTEEEIQEWINQVYYGNCCAHVEEDEKDDCSFSSESTVVEPEADQSNS